MPVTLHRSHRWPAALPDGSLLVARPNSEGRTQLTRVWPDTGRMQALPVDVTFDPGFRAVVESEVLSEGAPPSRMLEAFFALDPRWTDTA